MPTPNPNAAPSTREEEHIRFCITLKRADSESGRLPQEHSIPGRH